MKRSVARAIRVGRHMALAGIVLGLVGCTSPTSPTFRADFTQVDLRVGTGAEAASGQTVMVAYSGWLYDDTKTDKKGDLFDGSKPGQPFVFKLGTAQVIEGWDRGIAGMKVGGLRRLIIPSALAYGRVGSGSTIPPNATLVFEVELLAVVGG